MKLISSLSDRKKGLNDAEGLKPLLQIWAILCDLRFSYICNVICLLAIKPFALISRIHLENRGLRGLWSNYKITDSCHLLKSLRLEEPPKDSFPGNGELAASRQGDPTWRWPCVPAACRGSPGWQCFQVRQLRLERSPWGAKVLHACRYVQGIELLCLGKCTCAW